MKLSLRNRVLVVVLPLIAVAMAALSLTSLLNARKALIDTLNDELSQTADATVREIEGWVHDQVVNVETWSDDPTFKVAAAEGSNAAGLRQAANVEAHRISKKCEVFELINMADKSGIVIVSSDTSNIGKNILDRDYFQEAKKGKSSISSVLKSKGSGKPVFVVASPVRNGDSVDGVMFGVVSLDKFTQEVILPLKILQHGYAFMYDKQGIVMAHPDAEKILTLDLKSFDWGKEMLKQGTGAMDYTFSGMQKRMSFKTSSGLGWGVAVQAPMAELMAPVYQLGWISLWLTLAGLSIASVVVFLTTSSIARSIQQTIQALLGSADQIGASASHVAASTQSLAESSGEQAASLEETSSSLEEISSMSQHNAEKTTQCHAWMVEARSIVANVNQLQQEMGAAIQKINHSSGATSKVIKTIEEIAFQTNILALNAAVEAARAGEAGMGFAVVAEEVRNLAQRCAQAAKETSSLIETAATATHSGTDINDRLHQAFQLNSQIITKLGGAVDEIAAAVKEQSQGLSQITVAMSQIDKATQSNAANSEETAGAVTELHAQADALLKEVEELKLLVEGGRSRGAATSPEKADIAPPSEKGHQSATKPFRGRIAAPKRAQIRDEDFV